MKLISQLIIISLVAGTVLASVLKVIQLTLNIQAYILLFNMDYIPVLNRYDQIPGSGYVFHYVFCIVSVIGLYYIAKIIHLEAYTKFYVIIFTVGSGVLYFLTALTDKPPSTNSFEDWFFWTIAHAIFGVVVGSLIKRWIVKNN